MHTRRTVLKRFAGAGAGALIGATLIGGRMAERAYARGQFREKLLSSSAPLLSDKAKRELDSLPQAGKEELREYFHGICLRVEPFVARICSITFLEELRGCSSEQQRQMLFSVAFSQKVATPAEMLSRIDVIAIELGKHLDRNLSAGCRDLGRQWGKAIQLSRRESLNVFGRIEPLIRSGLQDAISQAYPIGLQPPLSEVGLQLGRAAIMALRFIQVGPSLFWPVFIATALEPVFRFLISQITDRREDYQRAISEQLALTGNRVAMEFETEVRMRIADLHVQQEQAIHSIAEEEVNEAMPWFFKTGR